MLSEPAILDHTFDVIEHIAHQLPFLEYSTSSDTVSQQHNKPLDSHNSHVCATQI